MEKIFGDKDRSNWGLTLPHCSLSDMILVGLHDVGVSENFVSHIFSVYRMGLGYNLGGMC